jgi:peptide chain release factor 1
VSSQTNLPAEFNIASLQKRYDSLAEQLTAPHIDHQKRQVLQKELSFLTTVLGKLREIEALEKQQLDLQQQAKELGDPAFAELVEEEISELSAKLSETRISLDALLFPPDEMDERSVFLEIRAGTGGQEAALFAADLLRMYTMYALKKGWQTHLMSESSTDLGGYREVVLEVKGKGVFGHLKHEVGVHRVQRVPDTETQGRVHTSTATVVVLPEADDIEVSINPADLRIDVYRASGAGGQHVNTTDSAVRITHIPTGTVVACQDERSQHKNKAKALKVLQSRILAANKEKQDAEESKKRKEMVGAAARSDKVRTYNFPQNRITDHRVDQLTLKNLDMVMEGALDPIIQALMHHEVQERRKKSTFAVLS